MTHAPDARRRLITDTTVHGEGVRVGEWASESTAPLSRLATSYLAVNKAVAGSVQHAKPLCEHGEHGRLWRGVTPMFVACVPAHAGTTIACIVCVVLSRKFDRDSVLFLI